MADAATTAKAAPAAPPATGGSDDVNPREVVIIAAVALVLITVAFFVLGRYYYIDKYSGLYALDLGVDADAAARAAAWDRVKEIYVASFAVFSVLAVGAMAAAVLRPREVAHGLTALFGLAYVATGVMALRGPMPALVGVAQLVLGGLLAWLTWVSWKQRDRAAWAFLMSLCVVLAIVHTFGAPRVRANLDIDLWIALCAPALLGAAVAGLYRIRRDQA